MPTLGLGLMLSADVRACSAARREREAWGSANGAAAALSATSAAATIWVSPWPYRRRGGGGSRADQLWSELAPSFLPGLDISIEGTRRKNENATPDHGIHFNLNSLW